MLSIEEGKDYDNVDDADLPYTHLRNLGHGHSGNVEEVRDELTKTVFARKTIYIPASRFSRQERTRVFHNEVKTIRALGRHRHIISVFATYVAKRHFGLILQPVASEGDLEDFLAEYWNIWGEVKENKEYYCRLEPMMDIMLEAFGCLAIGLAFMHEKNVRHKDIKPRNILIHHGRVLYTDFGYSFDSNGFSRSTTEGRPAFLTRKYSAPEVLDYEERNSKSDVYSLGCVFIDLLFALTPNQDPDIDINCYSESMSDIHERFNAWEVFFEQFPPLPKIITAMTMRDASKRLCAIHTVIELLRCPSCFCKECKSTPVEAWRERVQDHKCIEKTKPARVIPGEPADDIKPMEPAPEASTPRKQTSGAGDIEQSVDCFGVTRETASSLTPWDTSTGEGAGIHRGGWAEKDERLAKEKEETRQERCEQRRQRHEADKDARRLEREKAEQAERDEDEARRVRRQRRAERDRKYFAGLLKKQERKGKLLH